MSAEDNFQPMVVDWLTDINDIRAVRDHWFELENRASERTVYCGHDWVMCWYECYLKTKYSFFCKPVIGSVWKGDRLVVISTRSLLQTPL